VSGSDDNSKDDVDLHVLPRGYRLQGYRIERVLGQGGFGVTYLAVEEESGTLWAIKEYFPSEFAYRDMSHTIHTRSQNTSGDYEWGLARFIDEAETLRRFQGEPNIVNVHQVITGLNGTAYMVMEYEDGTTLDMRLKQEGRLEPETAWAIMEPLLGALERVHQHDVYHRDIKPDNIYLTAGERPVLLDFGAARQAVNSRTRSVSAIVAEGYSPIEQYSPDRTLLGPWSDIYAFAATMYHAIAGIKPVEAPKRSLRDTQVPLAEAAPADFHPAFLDAIDWALGLFPEDRPQTIGQWREALTAEWYDADVEDEIEEPEGAHEATGFQGENEHEEVREELVEEYYEILTDDAADAPVPTPKPKPRPGRILAMVLIAGLISSLVLPMALDIDVNSLLSPGPPLPVGVAIGPEVRVARSGSNIRALATTQSAKIGSLAQGAAARILDRLPGEGGEWFMIDGEADQPGYVFADLLVNRFRDCDNCPEMMVIPTGRFDMGSEQWTTEQPIHRVTVDKPFALGLREVSEAEWSACAAQGACRHLDYSAARVMPISGVTWYDVQNYVTWLSRRTGYKYRLPTEAEWEYAARGTRSDTLPWGGRWEEACLYENHFDLTVQEPRERAPNEPLACNDGFAEAAPVGRFRANGFGLHDMLGNVREWTADCWQYEFKGAPDLAHVPVVFDGCNDHTVRGGSWKRKVDDLRPSARIGKRRDKGEADIGFRVARDLD